MIDPKLWQDEFRKAYARDLEFYGGQQWGEEPPKLTWARRRWNRFRWWVTEQRERLGELVAGRRFDE